MNLPSIRRKALVSFGFLLLAQAACTSLPSAGPAEGGFHLRGKMGIVQGEDSFSARFLWQQTGEHFTMDLWGPLGQGRVRLTGNQRRLELREGDGTLISRGSPEAVMTRHLGWSLPLSVLPQWVRGHPARGVRVQAETRDEQGHLTSFRQLGWDVDLERYRAVSADSAGPDAGNAGAAAEAAGDAVFLPYRVTAQRDAYRVRLAISEWRI